MKTSRLILLALLLVSCSSATTEDTQRPASVARPDVGVQLANSIFFGSGTTAPATFDVVVRNNATVPLTLRRLEIASPGMAEYTIVPQSRIYSETIPPGETKNITYFGTARTNVSRLNPTEPLSVRAILDFEASGVRFREILLNRSADR